MKIFILIEKLILSLQTVIGLSMQNQSHKVSTGTIELFWHCKQLRNENMRKEKVLMHKSFNEKNSIVHKLKTT